MLTRNFDFGIESSGNQLFGPAFFESKYPGTCSWSSREMAMSTSAECQKHAQECVELAQTATNGHRQYLDFQSPFKPDELKAMTAAFERAILTLDLENRPDLTLPVIGATIIRLAKQGEFDPAILCERTVAALGNGADKMT